MTGDHRVRHCVACNRSVVDLSALTRAEAKRHLAAEAVPCVRYRIDADGGVRFRRSRGVRWLRWGLAVIATWALPAFADPPADAVVVNTASEASAPGYFRIVVLAEDEGSTLPIWRAQITVIRDDGETRVFETDIQGTLRFEGVPGHVYQARVEAPDLQTQGIAGIRLQAGQTGQFDVVMNEVVLLGGVFVDRRKPLWRFRRWFRRVF